MIYNIIDCEFGYIATIIESYIIEFTADIALKCVSVSLFWIQQSNGSAD
jgi:hypothetical protein